MSLDLYKMPAGFVDGVEIPLPQTDIVFRVILPAQSNEEFSAKLQASMSATVDPETKTIKVSPGEWKNKIRELFFTDCVKGATGLPDGMSVADFFAAYPRAASVIYRKAAELADAEDRKDEQLMGNSAT